MGIYRGLIPGAIGIGALLNADDSEAAFGGVLARKADDMMLNIAKKMKAEGYNRDEIWQKTGWGQGADDKWRFEIDDSQMSMEAPYMPVEGETFGEVFNDRLGGRRFLPYHHAFDNPNLTANYDLGTVGIIQGQPENVRGGYAENIDRIGINPNLPIRQAISTGAHEGQHAIQRREGFASGGGTDLPGGVDTYRRLAGEVEARNVQARQHMTPQERRGLAPWWTEDVPREDQIVRFGKSLAVPGILASGSANASDGEGGFLSDAIKASPILTGAAGLLSSIPLQHDSMPLQGMFGLLDLARGKGIDEAASSAQGDTWEMAGALGEDIKGDSGSASRGLLGDIVKWGIRLGTPF